MINQKWLSFAFDRYCRYNHHIIVKLIVFSNVKYRSGSCFSRSTFQTEPGYQLDLIFDREDNMTTVGEIKYLRGKVLLKVIQEFERKLELFPEGNKTVQSTFGAEKSVINRCYFDLILTLDDLFS